MAQDNTSAGNPSDSDSAKAAITPDDARLGADLTEEELAAVAGGALISNGNYTSVTRSTTR